jgi:hypothetical protein
MERLHLLKKTRVWEESEILPSTYMLTLMEPKIEEEQERVPSLNSFGDQA